MSLQGSLETLGLPDVLHLLATTEKSGELQVTGDRGTGRLWLTSGQMTGYAVGAAGSHVDALFELLRTKNGKFAFVDKQPAPNPGATVELLPLVAEAERRLVEWRKIEAVVPSLESRVELVEELDGEVKLSKEQWQLIRAIGDGRMVRSVLDRRSLGEFDGCAAVRDLVEAGLAKVQPPAVAKTRFEVPKVGTSLGAGSLGAGSLGAGSLGAGSLGAGSLGSGPGGLGGEPPALKETAALGSIPAVRVPPLSPSAFGLAESSTQGVEVAAPPAPKLVSGLPEVADKPVSDPKPAAAAKGDGDERPAPVKQPAGEAQVPAGPGPDRTTPAAAPAPEEGAKATSKAEGVRPAGKETAKAADGAPASSPTAGAEAALQATRVTPGAVFSRVPAPGTDVSAQVAGAEVESDAGDAESDDGSGDEPLNRGLLLKFLSSVRS